MFKKRIYLDYASLTPIDPRVTREMSKYSAHIYANPSSLYKEGVVAKKALVEMRKKVADTIHAHADEMVFTSGGTEANGLALEGVARAAHRNGILHPHIIISAIEHSSIIEVANMMEQHGCEVTRLPVDSSGVISLGELKKAIKPSTILVSIMTINNEIGSIQPIRDIAKVVRDARKEKIMGNTSEPAAALYPIFHTDAAQAFLYEELFVEKLGIDLMTLDGSKVYGPRGVGCLYIKRNVPIEPIIYGGGQERGMRSGTENLPGISGFTKALEIAVGEREKEARRISQLRQEFITLLHKNKPAVKMNGNGSPHILNISIPGVDTEFLLFQLDAHGIACSTKSSCLRDEDESYVLKAIGADSSHSLRFSFGRWTKNAHIKAAVKALLALI
jgi:cysteine desulfurase